MGGTQNLHGTVFAARPRLAPQSARKGRVSQFCATWTALFFLQSDMAGRLVADLGAKPVATSSNRNVFVAAYRLKDGKTGVFAINLHSSPQETTVTLPSGESHVFRLGAMEVGYGWGRTPRKPCKTAL